MNEIVKYAKMRSRLAASYTKAVLHNPKSIIEANIDRALEDCPDIFQRYNAFDDLVEALERMVEQYEIDYPTTFSFDKNNEVTPLYQSLKSLAKAKGGQ